MLLFDADCGFCTRVVGMAPRLRLDIDVRTMQSVDLPAYGIDPARAAVEIPYVATDGSISYGHKAIAAALQSGPLLVRALGRLITLPGIDTDARATYRWVSRHRHQLPGGTAACALPAQH